MTFKKLHLPGVWAYLWDWNLGFLLSVIQMEIWKEVQLAAAIKYGNVV